MRVLIFSNSKGFTLIEMIVGIFIFSILALGIISLVSSVFVSSGKQGSLIADSDQARKLSGTIMNELRNAQISSIGAYPLDTVSAQTLIFYSNIDGGNDIEKVRYFIQNGDLKKGVIKPSGNPLTYNSGNEVATTVQKNIANGSSPLFYYYDGTYEGITDNYLAQPVNVTDVKFIKLDLKVYNKGGLNNTNYYSVTASGAVRGLKDNLDEQGLPDYYYQLTTSVSPSGKGSVAVSPSGPDYPEHTLANLTATPILGYGFSSWTGNVTSPNSSFTTILMDQNESVTANFVSLPQTLTGSVSSKSGPQSARIWTLRVSNPNAFAVNNVNIYSFSLTHTSGQSCTPIVLSPAAFPVLVGNIGASSSRTYQVTINFPGGCNSGSKFTADFTFAGNSGTNWGSASINNQAP